ncbi:MAG: hypothetical protein WCJ30_16995 [Deltaproteobacteria bacterium]
MSIAQLINLLRRLFAEIVRIADLLVREPAKVRALIDAVRTILSTVTMPRRPR